ncbi:hypothetical protein PATSB16_29420 [Pandoraea thiooxydans]|nr:hypothetical protein PATSB16_29420 [Pandoraea thiooxydans]
MPAVALGRDRIGLMDAGMLPPPRKNLGWGKMLAVAASEISLKT